MPTPTISRGFAACLLALLSLAGTAAAQQPLRPKVMVLTTFEIGADTGDKPGELQYWVEREGLVHSLAIPGVAHPLRYNDAGVFAAVTGTCNRSGLAMMLIGSDPRLDLTHTYFVVAGIAGVDPDRASIGSAAWAQWVVDGDNVNEIDPRDGPGGWPYGIMPYGASGPGEPPGPHDWSQKPMAFELDPGLVAWAFALSKDVALTDDAAIAAYRSHYAGLPNAQRAPFVLLGDTLGTARYWHGRTLTRWAEDWCPLYTGGRARFVMTECEDQSIAYALHMLGGAGRVDSRRLLVLRTGSNFCEPPAGGDPVRSLLSGEAAGTLLAVESAYRVGSPVVHALVGGWGQYERQIPSSP